MLSRGANISWMYLAPKLVAGNTLITVAPNMCALYIFQLGLEAPGKTASSLSDYILLSNSSEKIGETINEAPAWSCHIRSFLLQTVPAPYIEIRISN